MSRETQFSEAELTAFFGCIRGLANAIQEKHPYITIGEEHWEEAIAEAVNDFDNHNKVVKFNQIRVDAIKFISFLGCHLLTFIVDKDFRSSVAHTLVDLLDSHVSLEREDGQSLPWSSRHHLARLIIIEADQSFTKSNDIWGQGFWRVGLYTSMITAVKLGLQSGDP